MTERSVATLLVSSTSTSCHQLPSQFCLRSQRCSWNTAQAGTGRQARLKCSAILGLFKYVAGRYLLQQNHLLVF